MDVRLAGADYGCGQGVIEAIDYQTADSLDYEWARRSGRDSYHRFRTDVTGDAFAMF